MMEQTPAARPSLEEPIAPRKSSVPAPEETTIVVPDVPQGTATIQQNVDQSPVGLTLF